MRLAGGGAGHEVTLWEDNLNSTIAHLHKLYQYGSGSLKRLEISDFCTLKNLTNTAASLLFSTVETLSFQNLENLQQLPHSYQDGSLKNLTKLSIRNCESMEEVIWKEPKEDETNKIAFPKLSILDFKDLPSLVSFYKGTDQVEFPKLYIMYLQKLPTVECVFSELSNESLFPNKVSFPNLEQLSLQDMDNMKEIWSGQLQSGSFSNLTGMVVRGCHRLRVVFTPIMARYLVHLQELHIEDCSLLEVIIAKEKEEDGREDTTLLQKLECVDLVKLPVLENLCHVAHDLVFPMLSDIWVIECPQLKTFSPGYVRTPKLNNVTLTRPDAKEQVKLWQDDLNNTIFHLHKQYGDGCGSLNRLEISDICSLENFAN